MSGNVPVQQDQLLRPPAPGEGEEGGVEPQEPVVVRSCHGDVIVQRRRE